MLLPFLGEFLDLVLDFGLLFDQKLTILLRIAQFFLKLFEGTGKIFLVG
jgi:hypothetical protein